MPAYKKHDGRLSSRPVSEPVHGENWRVPPIAWITKADVCALNTDVLASIVNATALAAPQVIQILLECYYTDEQLRLPQLLQTTLIKKLIGWNTNNNGNIIRLSSTPAIQIVFFGKRGNSLSCTVHG